MKLLERQDLLDRLESFLGEAGQASGVMVLVGGEAGAGKTALTQHFAAQCGTRARVMIGACDAMSTPRPLGPIFDIARDLGPAVRAMLRTPDRRGELFIEILDALSASTPVVLIIEDVHWADDATIDLLRFLGRRIERTHALVVVTYRDDEITGAHPLRSVLGDLATSASVRHMKVDLLTPNAVRTMAEGTEIDAEALHTRTNGNAFFVTEVIASGGTSLPPSARDAVLSRSARLPVNARRVLEVAAAIGGRISLRLLAEVSGANSETIDACIDAGLLQGTGDALMFRHELARDAVYDAIPPGRRVEIHGAILQSFLRRVESVADYPRLAHHADAAGDVEAVLRYAPEAAKRAAELGAHREAVGQYARALRYGAHVSDERRAELLKLAFPEEFAIGNLDACASIARDLTDLAHQRDDPLDEATWHAWRAWSLVHGGQNFEADSEINRAIELVEDIPPTPVHAHIWQIQSRLRMLNRDYALAISWGERAIALAQQFNLPRIHTGALNAIGSSRVIGGNEAQGRADLLRGLEIAKEAHLDVEVASLLTNLGSGHGEIYRFDEAERYLTEGIAFTREHDLDGWLWYMTSWLAMTRMFQGRWSEASRLAHTVINTPAADAISLIMAQITLGRLRARRGDPDVWQILDEALALSIPTKTLQRLAPARAARAEAAWLAGDGDRMIAEARAVLDMAVAHSHPWHIGELGYWLWKAGDLHKPLAGAAEPYARQTSGDWRGAAEAWMKLGCPYESARALAESGDEAAMREAFAIFDRLGAKPMAAMVTRQLRDMGAESIPRGARPTTRSNVALLTGREMDIVSLIVTGLTNVEIAERLYLSPRTVEKHVSSVLAKLDITSRHQIAEALEERGLPHPPSHAQHG